MSIGIILKATDLIYNTFLILQKKIQDNTLLLINSINAQSPAQAEFKPAENVWSILECAEHIFLVARSVSKIITAPPPIEKTENNKTELFSEQKLNILLVSNRTFKVPAPDYVSPKGDFVSIPGAVQNINSIIEKIIQHINSSDIEKDTQLIKHPLLDVMTKIDWIHFMIAHTNRHLLQIDELKAHPDFPAF